MWLSTVYAKLLIRKRLQSVFGVAPRHSYLASSLTQKIDIFNNRVVIQYVERQHMTSGFRGTG